MAFDRDTERPCHCEKAGECYGGVWNIKCMLHDLLQIPLPLGPTYDAVKTSEDDD